ncbi:MULTISPECIES: hypothetical protein [Marinobacter]|nr:MULTISPECIES: hypothetical protein [Marinobacter]UZD64977.1 hypothetical protein LJ360_15445 [Marinobacter sp. AN1]
MSRSPSLRRKTARVCATVAANDYRLAWGGLNPMKAIGRIKEMLFREGV